MRLAGGSARSPSPVLLEFEEAKGEQDWARKSLEHIRTTSLNHALQIADQSFHLLPRNIHPGCILNCGHWWSQWPHPWLPPQSQIWRPDSARWWALIAAACKRWRSGCWCGQILPSVISATHQTAGSLRFVWPPSGNHCRACSQHDFGSHPPVHQDKQCHRELGFLLRRPRTMLMLVSM